MTASAEGVQGSVSEVVENIPTFDINKAEFDEAYMPFGKTFGLKLRENNE